MYKYIVFRHQLFKVSEPFIVQQAMHLTRFTPLYLGRSRFGTPPPDAESLALVDLAEWRSLHRRIWQAITRDARPYLRLLKEQRPVLIHAHFGVDGFYALPLARRLGVPLVTTFHGFDATTSIFPLISSCKPTLINYALHRSQLAMQGDLFLCVSEFIRDRVLELGFPPERTFVHYTGIDTAAIRVRDPGEEKPIILHVARLVEKKGTEYLIRAFAQIVSRGSKTKLVIVGEGPLRERLQVLARRLEVSEHVHFTGAQKHKSVMAWMRKAALMVLPSVRAASGDAEGLGMVLLEAAATGVPIVATSHGGIPEMMSEGETGYLVPERSIEDLAKRMDDMLEDATKRMQMGARARALVEDRFDIRRQSRKLEAIYDNLIESSRLSRADS